jgi:hypothetical protein
MGGATRTIRRTSGTGRSGGVMKKVIHLFELPVGGIRVEDQKVWYDWTNFYTNAPESLDITKTEIGKMILAEIEKSK